MDEELEELRKKKLQELQQQAALQESIEEQEIQKKQVEEQKKTILRSIMTNPARERLARIKMARPEVAEAIEEWESARLWLPKEEETATPPVKELAAVPAA